MHKEATILCWAPCNGARRKVQSFTRTYLVEITARAKKDLDSVGMVEILKHVYAPWIQNN